MKRNKIYVLILLLIIFPITSVSAVTKVTCGNVTGIPAKIPELTRLFVTLIEIAVPVVLVIAGSIDLFKGITAQKEDEIKKGQQIFIKKLITGAIVFFIIAVVRIVISLVADSNSKNIVDCMDCFLSSESSCIVEEENQPVEIIKPRPGDNKPIDGPINMEK